MSTRKPAGGKRREETCPHVCPNADTMSRVSLVTDDRAGVIAVACLLRVPRAGGDVDTETEGTGLLAELLCWATPPCCLA
jgi:hypothetical protein